MFRLSQCKWFEIVGQYYLVTGHYPHKFLYIFHVQNVFLQTRSTLFSIVSKICLPMSLCTIWYLAFSNFCVTNNTYITYKRDILTDCQAGFRSKSRTTDHMFILKCLVDKYTNNKDNKFYACFVDFKRAFDTVIHPGMVIKMLKSDIGGNIYHLIKHMYTLNKLRVKVDNKLGQCFNSHIGVRKVVALIPSLFKIFINDLPNCLQSFP
jgi:hypothetical protein